ncbi:hypothetical protein D7Y21_16505 [Corallococcus sp. AB045]|nr:hypothetical protein D7Y21_16505 [Corallococcus sp. AB045]
MRDYPPGYFEQVERAALDGDSSAMLQMGVWLLGVSGSRLKRDPVGALRWLRRAAEEGGQAHAMELLAMEADSRSGRSPDAAAEAARWYARALDAYELAIQRGAPGARENAEGLRRKLESRVR